MCKPSSQHLPSERCLERHGFRPWRHHPPSDHRECLDAVAAHPSSWETHVEISVYASTVQTKFGGGGGGVILHTVYNGGSMQRLKNIHLQRLFKLEVLRHTRLKRWHSFPLPSYHLQNTQIVEDYACDGTTYPSEFAFVSITCVTQLSSAA